MKDGTPCPGCTSVLSALAGAPVDALLGWAVKLERQGLNWRSERQRSADVGTWIHDALEKYPDPLPPHPAWMTAEERTKVEKAFEAYAEWEALVQPEVVCQEVQLVSETLKAGGTPDQILRIQGRLTLSDHKTGKTLDIPKVCAQIAFYAHTAYEMGVVKEPIEEGLILHYTPQGLKPVPISPVQMAHGLEMFKTARQAYALYKGFPRS